MLETHVRGLLSGQATATIPKDLDGCTHNLSNGGVCILSSRPLQADTFVRCCFEAPDVPVSIPALMQVRWTIRRGHKPARYISGLQFVV
jgi:hypothetical protein